MWDFDKIQIESNVTFLDFFLWTLICIRTHKNDIKGKLEMVIEL